MALRNPKIFGLNVPSNFTDVRDKNTALKTLNLPSNDLDVIRGSKNAGATSEDWSSFSRLKDPIYRTLDRILSETDFYKPISDLRSSADSTLFGDLTINGRLSGASIRYRYVDGSGSSATIKFADISTSRVSAWISSLSPATATTPISYNSRVGIITGGSLEFGTPTTVGQIRLQTSITPQAKEFAAEIPTHKINCTIGGRTVSLYAMKGIPLTFTGNFRTLRPAVTLTSLIGTIRPSWKIVETANPLGFSTFTTSGLNSTIVFNSPVARERNIQFYYNPNNIQTITINSANISTLPEIKLSNLVGINLASNNFRNFPDLNTFSDNSGKLELVNFSQNPFNLSDTQSERRLDAILSKIPTSVKQLFLGGCFFGSVGINSIAERLPNLTILNLSRSGGPFLHPDNLGIGTIPNVPETCTTYEVASNDFRVIGPSSGTSKNIKELDNLVSLNLAGNRNLSDANFSISSGNNVIQSINISNTNLPCPDLSGKQSLISFTATDCRNIGFLTTTSNNYKFNECNSLTSLSFPSSSLSGRIPQFRNSNLRTINFEGTRLIGGSIDGDTSFVIPERTFEFCPKLTAFLLTSPSLLLSSPIHPNVFDYTPEIATIRYSSSRRTGGAIPNFANCSKLVSLYLSNNNFNSNTPTFVSNPQITIVDLSYNSLTGAIPQYRNLLRLNSIYLNNNQFTQLPSPKNLPQLQNFYVNNNLLSGDIPDFSECPRISFLSLFSNRFTNYTAGSLTTLYFLRYFDVANNLLSEQAVNTIVNDLFINYDTVKRGRVTINLRGNALPTGNALIQINFLRSKGWTIVYE
jgi:hypothetical protein